MDESSMKERESEQEDHSLFYQLRVRKIVKFNLGGIFSILKLSMFIILMILIYKFVLYDLIKNLDWFLKLGENYSVLIYALSKGENKICFPKFCTRKYCLDKWSEAQPN